MVYAVLNNGNGGRVDITDKLGRFGGYTKKQGYVLIKTFPCCFVYLHSFM